MGNNKNLQRYTIIILNRICNIYKKLIIFMKMLNKWKKKINNKFFWEKKILIVFIIDLFIKLKIIKQ